MAHINTRSLFSVFEDFKNFIENINSNVNIADFGLYQRDKFSCGLGVGVYVT